MTLILTLGNVDQVIQLSDRRLIHDGRLMDDESNKGGVLTCANARLAYGFTGLARIAYFHTNEWLRATLVDCGPPDFNAKEIIERFCDRATSHFNIHPALRGVSREQKRLSIMFSGYLYHHQPPLCAYAIVTNYQDFGLGLGSATSEDNFRCNFWSETRPANEVMSLIQRVGTWTAMRESDVDQLRKLLVEHRPPKAIIGKAVEILRDMADRPRAFGAIGKQISSILIPRDSSKSVETGYFSDVNRYEVVMPDMVVAVGQRNLTAVGNISVAPIDPVSTLPMAVRKVGRNRPCPCGSGKKYKNCHGR